LYRVEFKKSAAKEFHKLPAQIQRKVLEALQVLAINPYSELLQTKKLKGAAQLFRIRIGDYRVVYEVEKQKLIVVVIKIGHRSDVYR
jgi:mRNA interferase RelE/StbE